jgi:hypothetical protein
MVGNFVYFVRWPDGVMKVGSASKRSRWRVFVCRGASLLKLLSFDDYDQALDAETSAHEWMSTHHQHAFKDRFEAAPYLGVGGGGWTECYMPEVSSDVG